jgi:Polyketide cyclase / dehydrase and lipid transport
VADIHRTRTIAARAQEIWDVLADFGSISSWADNVDHSCILFSGADGGPIGTARRVQVKRDALVEQITEFDPPHALAYDIEGLPSRLRRVTNRWTLKATGDSTVVSLTSTVEIGPRAPQKLAERALCRFLARQSDVMLAGLANRLENARV